MFERIVSAPTLLDFVIARGVPQDGWVDAQSIRELTGENGLLGEKWLIAQMVSL
jgi:hypothetical protein